MIADHETNIVFVADTLERQFPAVYSGLGEILGRHGIPLRTIPGTRSVWCRDYMPIQVAEDRFVQFRYAPDYLKGKYRHLTKDGEIGGTLPFIGECVRSEIVLDGGNVVACDRRAIVTDKIFRENPEMPGDRVVDSLKSTLDLSELIVIPREPFDPIGHADGMVRWLDGGTVVVNNYRVVGKAFQTRILRTLRRHGLEMVEIPYLPEDGRPGEIPAAVGNWANFLRVDGLMVVPTFGVEGDKAVLGIFRRRLPDLIIEGLDCRELAKEGGLMNCVTWQVARGKSTEVPSPIQSHRRRTASSYGR